MDTACESSLARSDPERATKTGVKGGGRREAGIVGLALCFALKVPPFGLHRASLRARPTMDKQQTKSKKGDISALSSISVESGLRGAPVHKSSSAMHRFCGEQKAAQDLLAVLGVPASRKATQITAQMFEPSFAQVGRA